MGVRFQTITTTVFYSRNKLLMDFIQQGKIGNPATGSGSHQGIGIPPGEAGQRGLVITGGKLLDGL